MAPKCESSRAALYDPRGASPPDFPRAGGGRGWSRVSNGSAQYHILIAVRMTVHSLLVTQIMTI